MIARRPWLPMSLHELTVIHFSKMLGQLDAWLGKAVAYAEARSFEPDVLAQARLFPDQYALVRQVQSACDTAKGSAARLAGMEIPSHPDEETTIAELRERISKTRSFLETVTEDKYADAATREVTLSFLPGQAIKGGHYAIDFAVPNFFFHVTTAYAILRHNGVELGKRDFIGAPRLYPVKSEE